MSTIVWVFLEHVGSEITGTFVLCLVGAPTTARMCLERVACLPIRKNVHRYGGEPQLRGTA